MRSGEDRRPTPSDEPASGKNATPVVKVEGLRKTFGSLEVLKGIDFDVRAGRKISLIGPSGSGKTTLLRCINYLERPTAGRVLINGVPVGQKATSSGLVAAKGRELARARAKIGMVFQRFNLFPHLTVLDNVTIGPRKILRISRQDAEGEAHQLLCKVGLTAKAGEYPERLSGGQQQRVAIARALAMRPELMLFDEATSSLDPELVGEVLAVMRKLAAEGMTMIIVTHEMKFAQTISDEVIFIADGVVVEKGPPRAVFQSPAEKRTREFLQAVLDP